MTVGDCYVLHTSVHSYYFRYLGEGIESPMSRCLNRVHHYYTTDYVGTIVDVYDTVREWSLSGLYPEKLTDDDVIDKILMVMI